MTASSPMPRLGRATPPGETGQVSSFCDVKKDCEWLQSICCMYYMWVRCKTSNFNSWISGYRWWQFKVADVTKQMSQFAIDVWTFVFAQIPGACKTVVDLTAASPWESTFIFHRGGKWVSSIFHWGGGWVCPTIILSCFNHCWYKLFTCTVFSVTLRFPFPK